MAMQQQQHMIQQQQQQMLMMQYQQAMAAQAATQQAQADAAAQAAAAGQEESKTDDAGGDEEAEQSEGGGSFESDGSAMPRMLKKKKKKKKRNPKHSDRQESSASSGGGSDEGEVESDDGDGGSVGSDASHLTEPAMDGGFVHYGWSYAAYLERIERIERFPDQVGGLARGGLVLLFFSTGRLWWVCFLSALRWQHALDLSLSLSEFGLVSSAGRSLAAAGAARRVQRRSRALDWVVPSHFAGRGGAAVIL